MTPRSRLIERTLESGYFIVDNMRTHAVIASEEEVKKAISDFAVPLVAIADHVWVKDAADLHRDYLLKVRNGFELIKDQVDYSDIEFWNGHNGVRGSIVIEISSHREEIVEVLKRGVSASPAIGLRSCCGTGAIRLGRKIAAEPNRSALIFTASNGIGWLVVFSGFLEELANEVVNWPPAS